MYNNRTGQYKLVNVNKFIPPYDSHMGGFNEEELSVMFRSGLELRAFKYCDANPYVKFWSAECFNIKYRKPTDGKQHRYFIDLFIEFSNGAKFIVEVKSKGETLPPKKPSKNTNRALLNYQKALQTYAVNLAKWNAAKIWAIENGMRFIILTEDQLK